MTSVDPTGLSGGGLNDMLNTIDDGTNVAPWHNPAPRQTTPRTPTPTPNPRPSEPEPARQGGGECGARNLAPVDFIHCCVNGLVFLCFQTGDVISTLQPVNVPRPQQSIDDIPSRRSFLEWWRSGDTAGDYWQSVSSRNGNHSAYLGYARATGLRINHPGWGASISEAFYGGTHSDDRFSAGISVINVDAGVIQYRGQGVHSSWNVNVLGARANLEANVGWVEQVDGSRNLVGGVDAGISVSAFSAGYNFDIPFTGINIGFSGHLAAIGAQATLDTNRGFELKFAKFIGGSVRISWRGGN